MKVCLVLPSFLPKIGGLEKAADRLGHELLQCRHEPIILTRALEKPEMSVKRPFPIRQYNKPVSATWWPYSIETVLKDIHREFQLDVICAFHPYPPGYCAVRFGQRHGIPTIVSCRGGDIGQRSRYLKRWISRTRTIWSLEHTQAVHVLSEELSERIMMLTKNKVRSHVIHNGVDIMDSGPPGSMPPQGQPLEGRPFLLTLGRLRKFKGIDTLLDAMAILKHDNVKMPLLAIVGDGPETPTLTAQVQALGLSDQVRFLGEIRGPDKAWLLANCVLFIHPSRGGEGMPNSVLEALSYGRAIVGTRIGGVTDLIRDACGGILVEPENPHALADAIRQALTSDLAKMSEDAKHIAKAHTWDKIAAQYIELLESIVHQRRGIR